MRPWTEGAKINVFSAAEFVSISQSAEVATTLDSVFGPKFLNECLFSNSESVGCVWFWQTGVTLSDHTWSPG
jgi:hypothetical protein